jgi:hypothetical protein
MTKRTLYAMVAAVVLAAAGSQLAAQDECDGCLKARFWHVPIVSAADAQAPEFPETTELNRIRPGAADLGIAFSGGGTRSAAAAIGQLRGLIANKWLSRVRYMTAVSGGAWTIVPFAFSKDDETTFLGKPSRPDDLTVDYLDGKDRVTGTMAEQIAGSSLAASGIREGLSVALASDEAQSLAERLSQRTAKLSILKTHFDDLRKGVQSLVLKHDGRVDKTYGRLLADHFLNPLIEGCPGCGPTAISRSFTWDPVSLAEMSCRQSGASLPKDMLLVNRDRPFPIIGSTMVVPAEGNDAYPSLVPVEFTPLYSGTRRGRLSSDRGTYIWSWAYDSPEVMVSTGDYIYARLDDKRPFSLADVIAATGAAPQLTLLLAEGVPAQLKKYEQMAATYFPTFASPPVITTRNVEIGNPFPHSDGGLTDNMGVMPLLARQIRNVILFFNTNTRLFEQNDDVKSLFMPVGTPDGGGDKTGNQVFAPGEYDEVIRQLTVARTVGAPQIYCRQNLTVLSNPRYNIHGYSGLNLCLFYNADSSEWHKHITDARVAALFTNPSSEEEKLDNFPWFDTFEQNKPNLIQLTPRQVNLLGNLTEWSVTRPETRTLVENTFGKSVLEVPAAASPTADAVAVAPVIASCNQ